MFECNERFCTMRRGIHRKKQIGEKKHSMKIYFNAKSKYPDRICTEFLANGKDECMCKKTP